MKERPSADLATGKGKFKGAANILKTSPPNENDTPRRKLLLRSQTQEYLVSGSAEPVKSCQYSHEDGSWDTGWEEPDFYYQDWEPSQDWQTSTIWFARESSRSNSIESRQSFVNRARGLPCRMSGQEARRTQLCVEVAAQHSS